MSPWQQELKNSITNYSDLLKLLNLDSSLLPKELPNTNFPLFVTQSFVKRIQINNINDPLLLQILPTHKENISVKNYTTDPLQETKFNKIPGLIHKYSGRVLILSTASCPIACRYCFRKEFPYNRNIASGKNLEQIINYILENPSINEVILSGGDPLIATNNHFYKLISRLEEIPQLTTLRIHSRVPIILPSRLEPELINILVGSRFNIILVTHCNHPNEINQEVVKYFKNLQNTKIILLNHSVLLKNINDNADVLATLSKKLFELKVLPYYLHMLDPIKGTAHFAVSLTTAKKIFSKLTTQLPGYLLPRLVIEQPGKKSKTIIS